LHDATTDLDVIRAWWTRTPNANVGLRTGLVFDVVDLDSEDAVDALEEARGGREPLRGPLVATGKGFHYYVQLAGIGNRAGILPGVDYRGRGGYVVGPPSEHPDGHRYRWVNPLRDELARVPQWLIQLLVPERGPERPRAVPEGSRAYGLGVVPIASAALPDKGRESQPPAQCGFVQYGPISSRRRYRRDGGRFCTY